MPHGVCARDVKFLGVVQSIDEERKFGMVRSEEGVMLWECEMYAHDSVLSSVGATIGDTIRFGVHISNRGKPQVSRPIWKVGLDGSLEGPEDSSAVVNAEEAAVEYENFLPMLKEEIEGRSVHQNQKRTGGQQGGPPQKFGGDWKGEGKGKGKGKGNDMSQQYQSYDASGKGYEASGKGYEASGKGGKSAATFPPPNPDEVTLYVNGLPAGVQVRELAHSFRQYQGYVRARVVQKHDHTIGFVTYATNEQAEFVAQALSGYTFDEAGGKALQVIVARSQSWSTAP